MKKSKKIKLSSSICTSKPNKKCDSDNKDHFSKLSLEILIKIFAHLSIRDILRLESTCCHFKNAAVMHLKTITAINFIDKQIYGYLPKTLTDEKLDQVLKRCPKVKLIYGFHATSVQSHKRSGRLNSCLSIPGIAAALDHCPKLCGIETSSLQLLEYLIHERPTIRLLNGFENRNGEFPIPFTNKLCLVETEALSFLSLIGVRVSGLPKMLNLKRLHLEWVQLTSPTAFEKFKAPNLQSLVIKHSSLPSSHISFSHLIIALLENRCLTRLHLDRVPHIGGRIYRYSEQFWQQAGFRQLNTISLSSCPDLTETDLGTLVIRSHKRLEHLFMQPSLTRDSVFHSLAASGAEFSRLLELSLGVVDSFCGYSNWSARELEDQGLASVSREPCTISDRGMEAVACLFNQLQYLTINNCPHLFNPLKWFRPGVFCWLYLKVLTLQQCSCVDRRGFCLMIRHLPRLESLHLIQMFHKRPLNCSAFGLSVTSSFMNVANSPNFQQLGERVQEALYNRRLVNGIVNANREENINGFVGEGVNRPNIPRYEAQPQGRRHHLTGRISMFGGRRRFHSLQFCRQFRSVHTQTGPFSGTPDSAFDFSKCTSCLAQENKGKSKGKQARKKKKSVGTMTDGMSDCEDSDDGDYQEMDVESSSLKNINLTQVGIKNLRVSSSAMSSVMLAGCPNLKRCDLFVNPALCATNISQCPSLNLRVLLLQLSLTTFNCRCLTVDGRSQFALAEIQNVFDDRPEIGFTIVLDFCCNSERLMKNQFIIQRWPDFLKLISQAVADYRNNCLKKRLFSKKLNNKLQFQQFVYPNTENQMHIISNLPWIPSLSQSSLANPDGGLFDPESAEACRADFVSILRDDAAEFIELNTAAPKKFIVLHILVKGTIGKNF